MTANYQSPTLSITDSPLNNCTVYTHVCAGVCSHVCGGRGEYLPPLISTLIFETRALIKPGAQ